MTLTLDRQNRYRDRFRQERIGWSPATEVYEQLIRERLRPGMRILDLGCGRGGILEQLGAAVDHPFGIDPDARSLVEHRLPELPRAAALADALPLPNESFDGVVCSWVLEHVTDPPRVFAEIARVLRPGGFFVCLTPNARAAVTLVNRALHPAQSMLVRRLYGRSEADTFPVTYRANTHRRMNNLAQQAGLILDEWRAVRDPTYWAFSPLLYRLSVLLCRVTPPVHLVGAFRRNR
ncbi:MAG: class I SAM-dependent methyltransferase [Aggregatilineales bacterium]